MEWLWTIIAMAVAGGLTYLISRLGVSGKIGKYVELVEDIKNDLLALATVILGALKPDEDGQVRVTTEEVTAIKFALANLMEDFGIVLPI